MAQHDSLRNPLSMRIARLLEIALAASAALATISVSVSAAELIAGPQPLWLLPGLYLVEMAAVVVAGAAAILLAGSGQIRGGSALAWIALGVLAAFIVLGAMTIGFAFLPAAGLLLCGALLCDARLHAPIAKHLLFVFAAAVGQAALMLAVVALS